ncbi:MAG TPA: CBS domain-containing protein [Acidimicrobiia bacterium]|nr:CBS domain-containing protein [Acidimicrobiia bacterium]
MKVYEIMTKNVVSVGPETPFKTVVDQLLRSGVSGLPVLDESGKLVGIVTEADLASKEAYGVRGRRTLSLLADVLAAPRWMHKAFGWVASDVMTKEVIVCAPDDDVRVATRRMLERDVKRMPVVQSGSVVGMLSRQDILRTLVRPDEVVDASVGEVLRTHPNRPDDAHVTHSVKDGIVTLKGDVRYAWDVPIVMALVRNADGVIDVVGKIHHREPDPRPVASRIFG